MSLVMPYRCWVHARSSSASTRLSWVKTVLAGILRAQKDAFSVLRMIYLSGEISTSVFTPTHLKLELRAPYADSEIKRLLISINSMAYGGMFATMLYL